MTHGLARCARHGNTQLTPPNWGERPVDAGTASMVVNVGPIILAVLGGWLLREGFPPRRMAGLVVSAIGAIVVGGSMSGGGRSPLLGVALCLVAALSYAAGVVGQKPALRHASALQVTTFGCIIDTVACLPFAGRLIAEVQTAPVSMLLWVVYLGAFPTALAFTTWAYALARSTAGKMGSKTYAVPAVVVLLSWLFLGEVPALLTALGGIICLAGVAISRGRSRRAAADPLPVSEPATSNSPSTDQAGGDQGSGKVVSVPGLE